MDDFQNILENGINFGRGGDKPKDNGKVKTKAKKKQYITGAHGRKPNTVSNGLTAIRNKECEGNPLALFILEIQVPAPIEV